MDDDQHFPVSQPAPEFVPHSGGSIVSRNILEGRARLRWAVRESQANPVDNGWRFFSEIDDDDYLADAKNLEVASFNTVAAIEPAIIPLLHMPVGTDLVLVRDGRRIVFIDNNTGGPVEISLE